MMRTPLSKVRGLGSAKDGTEHFWIQRLTAVALIPLVIWFVVMIAMSTGADFFAARSLIASPWGALPMVLVVVIGAYHMKLGLQVVIEDYVTGAARMTLLIINSFGCALIGLFSVFSILAIAFGG